MLSVNTVDVLMRQSTWRRKHRHVLQDNSVETVLAFWDEIVVACGDLDFFFHHLSFSAPLYCDYIECYFSSLVSQKQLSDLNLALLGNLTIT